MSEQRPNVILIQLDQMRHDCGGFAGSHVAQTPTLDRMAEEGVCFERAYCASPVCSPARASWISGLYPHGHGQLGNYWSGSRGHDGYHLREDVLTLGDAFNAEGYRCGMIGPWHMGNDETPQHGFDAMWCSYRYVPEEKDEYLRYLDGVGWKEAYESLSETILTTYRTPGGDVVLPVAPSVIPTEHQRTTWAVNRAIEFVENEQNDFFLFLNIKDPHPTISPPQEILDRYHLEDIEVPDNWNDPLDGKPEFQKTFGSRRAPKYGREGMRIYAMHYIALVTHIDNQLARLFDALKASGSDQDTLVAFVSDHGEMLGEHGFVNKILMYESSVRVPLLLRWPGRIPAGLRVNTPIAAVDLMPTLLALTQVPLSADVHGRSLASDILAGRQPQARPVFAEIAAQPAIGKPDMPREMLGNCVMVLHEEWKYVGYRNGDEELYFLADDPNEMVNRADLPEYAARKTRMKQLIRDELAPGKDGVYAWCA